ncbi:MAG: tRNA pseudouridine(54/55) synthase Pus10 [Candidatus Thermoplasmatota archaeon]|nr:tRNA pseudouridine(54/55) synthase Pus10 [Candidatus Thermoplasmatota archaeon]MCL5963466.1 tRNA pseudouridine(54/55) synthase Pus10 [Candidatus Thermoplasmatota archaeon]
MNFIDEIKEEMKDTIAKLNEMKLCIRCRGRALGKVGKGYTNIERGLAIGGKDYDKECEICSGIFLNFEKYYNISITKLDGIEFSKFSVGSRFDSEIYAKEEQIWNESGTKWGESIKSEFNREFGKYFLHKAGKEASIEEPDVTILVDTSFDTVTIVVYPIYIYGRYRKYIRSIPQTRWNCRACNGKGCDRCSNTGKLYDTSIEEQIAYEIVKETEPKDEKFHGMGREDIDALMVGDGRPFIIELREPKKRIVNLELMEKKINQHGTGKIEVTHLSYVKGSMVERIKNATPDKEYIVTFITDAKKDTVLLAIETIKGKTIMQKTPTRVLSRRADLIRKREVKDIILVDNIDKTYKLKIRAESGTYIKELINGDGGRTTPSFTEVVGTGCEVKELDVVKVYY